MRAAITTQPGHVEIVDDLHVAPPSAGEVAVRVSFCGLCLTDVHIMEGSLDFPHPVICGHEVSGLVEETGGGVDGIRPGDAVVVSCRPPCRSCFFCLKHQPHLCSRALGWKTGELQDGTTRLSWRDQTVYRGVGVAGFAERVIVPATGAVPIPADMPVETAAVLGCAVQTGAGAVFNTAQLRPGDTALVIGLGGVGNAAVQAARCSGASLIIGIDPLEARRDLALNSGADIVFDPDATDLVAEVQAATAGVGIDFAFDAVADPAATVLPSLAALRPGGLLVVIGVPAAGTDFLVPGPMLVSDERRMSGCFLGSADPQVEIPKLISLWRRGRLDLDVFVSDRQRLEDLPDLLKAESRSTEGLRTVLSIGDGP